MQPLASVLPRVVAEAVRNAPLSPGKVDFAWKASVGPAMGRGAAVRLEGTTLLVDTVSTEWRREVRRGSPVILFRMQAILGNDVITEIVVRA
jgi:predicted nucleic acid-binding Zn ribbon protein